MSETTPSDSGGSTPQLDTDPPDGNLPRFPPGAGAAGAPSFPSPSWEPGVVEVQFREAVGPAVVTAGAAQAAEIRSEGEDLAELNRVLQQHGLQGAEPTFRRSQELDAEPPDFAAPNLQGFVTMHFPPDADTVQIAEDLERLPEVERAVPIPRAVPPQTPLNEPLVGISDHVVVDASTGFENQWYIFRCGVNRAWGRSSGTGVVVADIDWGYRTSHEDLATQLDLSRAYNSYDGGTNVSHGSFISHGTAVMGIAGGADNDRGMAGVAFNSRLWPIQANSGPGTSLGGNEWARAIDWVRTADSGGRRKVIILEVQTGSFGNYEMVPSVNAAIRAAIAAGVVVCVAAGNGDRDAGIDDLGNAIPDSGSILVGATEYHVTENRRAWFSNFNARIVVCAPGDGSHDLTCSSSADNAYRNGFGGTSGATPKVAATAALMLAVNPSLTHAQLKTMLFETGSAVITDAAKPVGRHLDANAAVQRAAGLAQQWSAWAAFHGSGDRLRGVVVGQNADGRLEVFGTAADESVWHTWQVAPGGAWSAWAAFHGSGDRLRGVVVGQNADGRLEVFGTAADESVWHTWQVAPGGAWSAWAAFHGSGDRLRSVVVGQNADGRLEVFGTAADESVWHTWQVAPGGAWSAWAAFHGSGDRLRGVVVGQNADGRLEVFGTAADESVWHTWQVAPGGAWSAWAAFHGSGDRLRGVVVGQNADGRLEVFGTAADESVWHTWQVAPGGAWSAWAAFHGSGDRLRSVVVGQNADGRLEVFGTAADESVWHTWQVAPGGAWSAWAAFHGSGDRLRSVVVGQNADGRLEVFGTAADESVWHTWQTA